MKIRIPLSILSVKALRKFSQPFHGLGSKIEKNFPSLKLYLEQADFRIGPQEYLAMCITSSIFNFILLVINLIVIFIKIDAGSPFIISIAIAIVTSFFIFLQQAIYPKLLAGRKIRNIEKNLMPALQDMLVQLNSGIPLFNILVNISHEKYGEVSAEFSRAVNKIGAGIPQVEVLDEVASRNPSLYLRRSLWQLVNGMKTGADTGIVVKEIISALTEEQLLQIQRYGSQLNPLAMFYMLITVILPSLGMTFLIVLSSFISASEIITKLIFWGLYGFVLFFQVMFLGIIKTKRPTLLER